MGDEQYMRRAIELAKRGCGWVNPNPLVGAVVVKGGRIIGEGYHARCGQAHAERRALTDCAASPVGATLYVTLEPCCHEGRTPPCTEAMLASGIARVVIGSRDPNPLVAGKGVEALRAQGVEVVQDVERGACDEVNRSFFHFIQHRTPYVVMKYAMTMDGKIATASGLSRWITGEAARLQVHQDRLRHSAIMVGVGTVLADDPLLTCRIEGGRNPLRVVCDTHLRTPETAAVVATSGDVPTVIATAVADADRHRPYRAAGCGVMVVPRDGDHIDLAALMRALGEREVDSLLLEGGGTLNWSALRSGVVHRVQAYVAPKIFGGRAMTPVGGAGVAEPGAAVRLGPPAISRLGDDLLLDSEVLACSPES
ncbi:MAG: bifunctional diaminohydroxyphosphoribosylaminopyrimidine deaminase/5-amino-6-(5-phosphoribosylamino)uracil reductase RibD [Propioniciclava sp.]|uniref:bifunctional diaminohydroxyphosphoribosylaminopyrimidine deaminase/5-amino-6-(5-phosphoribosylamino)uracil reductase RibD n=1 Tax=Propioniciclava sp. TaxID=2038686 RepID=UPI0039E42CC0